MKNLIYPTFTLWGIFSTIRTLPRLEPGVWSTLNELGIAKRPTNRGCRGGINQQRHITSVQGLGNQSNLAEKENSNVFGSHSDSLHNMQIQLTAEDNDDPLGIVDRGRNVNNLIIVNSSENLSHNNNRHFVPSIGLSNVMSLAPKIDEMKVFLAQQNLDLMAITETWLKDSIPDNCVHINNYNCFRKDRTHSQHGGVCLYIKNNIPSKRLDLDDPAGCEALWIQLTPERLQRGFNSVIVGVIYHPPSADNTHLLEYLEETLSKIECLYPNAGLLIVGDFNRADVRRVKNQFRLKQTVSFPTRGPRTLDLILTNLETYYDDPQQLPPFGLSDHCTIVMTSRIRVKDNLPSRTTVLTRDKKYSSRQALGRYLSTIDWPTVLNNSSIEEKYSIFHNVLQAGLDQCCPTKKVHIHHSDSPWMTTHLKTLIALRQKYFKTNGTLFNLYRNKVNKERKKCKSTYYSAKVSHLKQTDTRKWWTECRKLCGMSKSTSDLATILLRGSTPTKDELTSLANNVNNGFLEPQQGFSCLSPDFAIDTDGYTIPSIPVVDVEKYLRSINCFKAGGPDEIPNWTLQEFSYELAIPVCDIINSSIAEGVLPSIWKSATVCPIPKVSNIQDIKSDLRPISLTPTLSKIAEHFIVNDHVKPAVLRRLSKNQFGCIPNSSTTHALIKLVHNWALATDQHNDVRAFIFDFKKAFDLIDHTILIGKLRQYSINPYIINWIVDFLKDRQQRVRLSNECLSEWKSVPAGVPQGTKLGPWLFIVMIDDLKVPSASGDVKFVDDTTVYEIVKSKSSSTAQIAADEFCRWSSENKFQIHPRKCKELRISFSRSPTDRENVTINDQEIKPVESVKILGVFLQSDLKWSTHVTEITKKASKRLYFLTQLKRAGVESVFLVRFYTACIRSLLLYACQVFHYSLPDYLSQQMERIQKRALRIIYGFELPYKDALNQSGLQYLSQCREERCKTLFDKIIQNEEDNLHDLLPFNKTGYNSLRKKRRFSIPICKTNRLMNTFIVKSAQVYDDN